MSILIDVIVVAIFVFSIFISYVKGLSAVIYQVSGWLITIILLFLLCKPVTNVIIDKTTLDERISGGVENSLVQAFGTDLDEGNEVSENNSNISNSTVKLINKYIDEAKNEGAQDISEYVANKISYGVISAISILGIFLVARLISNLVRYVVEFIAALPILKTFNKIGGILYGAIRGFLIIYIFLGIFSLLSPMLANTEIIAAIKSSYIASIFYNNNILLDYVMKNR